MRGNKFLRTILAELESGNTKLLSTGGFSSAFSKPAQNSVSQRAFRSATFSGASTRIGSLANTLRAPSGSGTNAQLATLASRLLGREARCAEMNLWRRLFSSETPRKGWDKFYPKNKPRRPTPSTKPGRGKPPVLTKPSST